MKFKKEIMEVKEDIRSPCPLTQSEDVVTTFHKKGRDRYVMACVTSLLQPHSLSMGILTYQWQTCKAGHCGLPLPPYHTNTLSALASQKKHRMDFGVVPIRDYILTPFFARYVIVTSLSLSFIIVQRGNDSIQLRGWALSEPVLSSPCALSALNKWYASLSVLLLPSVNNEGRTDGRKEGRNEETKEERDGEKKEGGKRERNRETASPGQKCLLPAK